MVSVCTEPARGGRSCEHFGGYKTINRIPLPFITPVLKELHWLPVRRRIEFKILLLVYKCLHGTALSYLGEMLKKY